MAMLAVDFNHWKTVSNWSALASSVDAIILKATQYTAYLDPTFPTSLAAARKTGKCLGVYHFVGRNGMQAAKLPPGDPVAEANWFLSKYAHQAGEMVIVDYEPDAEPTDPDAWLAAHCARIIAVTGVVPVVYMNTFTAAARSWAKTRALGCALWAARYYANNGQISGPDPAVGAWGSFIGWQYTSNGSLPGISAQVDLSRFDLTAAQWRAYGGSGKPAPPPPPPPPTVKEDAMRLIKTPDNTIWKVTDTEVVAEPDPAVANALAAIWGLPVAMDFPAKDAIFLDADARAKRQMHSVQSYVLGADPGKDPSQWLFPRVVGLGDAVKTLQAGGVDAQQVADLVIAGIKAVFAAQPPA